jgi:hypothetical protein
VVDVLEFLREQEPSLRQMPDRELTEFAGDTYPELLKDAAFSQAYARVRNAGTNQTATAAGPAVAVSAAPVPIEPGNIDVNLEHPPVKLEDGSVATVLTIGKGTDQGEVVIPTVVNGRRLSEEEAWQRYLKTGKHFGIFKTVEEADAAGQQLHEAEAKRVQALQSAPAAPAAPAPDALQSSTNQPAKTSGTDILDFLRDQDPRLRSVPDRELTEFAGDTYPELLQDPAFSKEYDLVRRSPSRNAVVPFPGRMERNPDLARLGDQAAPARQLLSLAEPSGAQHLEELTGDQFFQPRAPILGEIPERTLSGMLAGSAAAGPRPPEAGSAEPLGPWETINTPLVGLREKMPSGEQVEDVTGLPERVSQIIAGTGKAGASVAEFFATPLGIATLGSGMLPKGLQKLIGALFVADMAKNAPALFKSMRDAVEDGRWEDAVEAGVSGGANTFLAGHGFKSLIGARGRLLLGPIGDRARARAYGDVAAEEMQRITPTREAVAETAQLLRTGDGETRIVPGEEVKEPAPDVTTVERGAGPEPERSPVPGGAQAPEEMYRLRDPTYAWLDQEGAQTDGESVTETRGESGDIPPDTERGISVGPGAASPAEFTAPKKFETGIRNAIVDQARAQRGMPPADPVGRRAFGDVWDEAAAIVDEHGPAVIDDLVRELDRKPRALTDLEDALLLHRQIDLENELNKAQRGLIEAHDNGDTEGQVEWGAKVGHFSDALLELYNVGKRAGTETGRGLNARKMIAAQDFSLANMTTAWRAAKGGQRLSSQEIADLQKVKAGIDQSQGAVDAHVARMQERISELEAQKALHEIEKQNQPSPLVRSVAEKIVASLDQRADAARARLKQKMGQTSSGVDPTILLDLAEIGASHLGHVGLDFARWSKRMLEDLGDWVKPHLDQVYAESGKVIDAIKAAPAVKAIVKKERNPAEGDAIGQAIRQKVEDGKAKEIAPEARKLARMFVELGITDRNELITAVHDELKKFIPELTRRQAMDAISGYGDFRELSKDAVSTQLRELKGEMQQVGKLEDMQEGLPPKKTGVERREVGDKERRLIKEVNEMKKRLNFSTTDPATQLKSALDSIKTRLNNQISDLAVQIARREKIVKEKSPSPSDPEVEQLRAKRDALKAEFDDIFPADKSLTEEQRLDRAKAAVQRGLDKLEGQLRNKEAGKGIPRAPKVKPPTSPELEAMRARREALKSMIGLFREVDTARSEEVMTRQIFRTIDELERQINHGDLARPEANKALSTPALEKLRERRDALRKHLEEMRQASPEGKAEAVAKAESAVQESIDELERRIKERDLEVQKTVPITTPRLEALRERRANLTAALRELQAATPEGRARAVGRAQAEVQGSIAELERQLREGDTARKPGRKLPTTPELEKLRERRDALSSAVQKMREATPEARARAIERAKEQVQQSLDEIAQQINSGEIEAKKRGVRSTSPELEAMRAERDQMAQMRHELRKALKPRKTQAEITLAALKSRLTNRIAELTDKMARGDYRKTERAPVPLDREALQLQATNQRLKDQFKRLVEQERLQHRPAAEKLLDQVNKLHRRAILSGISVLGKLTGAAVWRVASRPVQEAIGGVIGKVIPGIARKANVQGGFSPRAEMRALSGLGRGVKDAVQVMRTGQGGLDVMHGKFRISEGHPFWDFFTRSHGALKAPVKRAEFERIYTKLMQYDARRGVDVTDPAIQARNAALAYKEANRSIFLEDNRVVTAYKAFLGALERPEKGTGHVPLVGKTMAAAGRVAIPIVRVPMNIVAQTFEHVFGTVTGSVRAARAYARGIEKLTPDEANLIMRQLKNGSLGGALALLGFFNPDMFGGYRQKDEKRQPRDIKAGAARIAGQNISKMFLHAPLIEAAQMGATVARVAQSRMGREGGYQKRGLSAGAQAALWGLLEETPFLGEMLNVAKAADPRERESFVGEMTKSLVIPQLIQQAARVADQDARGEEIRRAPRNFGEQMKTGIPGLREQVPRAKPRM